MGTGGGGGGGRKRGASAAASTSASAANKRQALIRPLDAAHEPNFAWFQFNDNRTFAPRPTPAQRARLEAHGKAATGGVSIKLEAMEVPHLRSTLLLGPHGMLRVSEVDVYSLALMHQTAPRAFLPNGTRQITGLYVANERHNEGAAAAMLAEACRRFGTHNILVARVPVASKYDARAAAQAAAALAVFQQAGFVQRGTDRLGDALLRRPPDRPKWEGVRGDEFTRDNDSQPLQLGMPLHDHIDEAYRGEGGFAGHHSYSRRHRRNLTGVLASNCGVLYYDHHDEEWTAHVRSQVPFDLENVLVLKRVRMDGRQALLGALKALDNTQEYEDMAFAMLVRADQVNLRIFLRDRAGFAHTIPAPLHDNPGSAYVCMVREPRRMDALVHVRTRDRNGWDEALLRSTRVDCVADLTAEDAQGVEALNTLFDRGDWVVKLTLAMDLHVGAGVINMWRDLAAPDPSAVVASQRPVVQMQYLQELRLVFQEEGNSGHTHRLMDLVDTLDTLGSLHTLHLDFGAMVDAFDFSLHPALQKRLQDSPALRDVRTVVVSFGHARVAGGRDAVRVATFDELKFVFPKLERLRFGRFTATSDFASSVTDVLRTRKRNAPIEFDLPSINIRHATTLERVDRFDSYDPVVLPSASSAAAAAAAPALPAGKFQQALGRHVLPQLNAFLSEQDRRLLGAANKKMLLELAERAKAGGLAASEPLVVRDLLGWADQARRMPFTPTYEWQSGLFKGRGETLGGQPAAPPRAVELVYRTGSASGYERRAKQDALVAHAYRFDRITLVINVTEGGAKVELWDLLMRLLKALEDKTREARRNDANAPEPVLFPRLRRVDVVWDGTPAFAEVALQLQDYVRRLLRLLVVSAVEVLGVDFSQTSFNAVNFLVNLSTEAFMQTQPSLATLQIEGVDFVRDGQGSFADFLHRLRRSYATDLRLLHCRVPSTFQHDMSRVLDPTRAGQPDEFDYIGSVQDQQLRLDADRAWLAREGRAAPPKARLHIHLPSTTIFALGTRIEWFEAAHSTWMAARLQEGASSRDVEEAARAARAVAQAQEKARDAAVERAYQFHLSLFRERDAHGVLLPAVFENVPAGLRKRHAERVAAALAFFPGAAQRRRDLARQAVLRNDVPRLRELERQAQDELEIIAMVHNVAAVYQRVLNGQEHMETVDQLVAAVSPRAAELGFMTVFPTAAALNAFAHNMRQRILQGDAEGVITLLRAAPAAAAPAALPVGPPVGPPAGPVAAAAAAAVPILPPINQEVGPGVVLDLPPSDNEDEDEDEEMGDEDDEEEEVGAAGVAPGIWNGNPPAWWNNVPAVGEGNAPVSPVPPSDEEEEEAAVAEQPAQGLVISAAATWWAAQTGQTPAEIQQLMNTSFVVDTQVRAAFHEAMANGEA